MAVSEARTGSRMPAGVWVFLGGSLGALTRAALGSWIPDSSTSIPVTTLTINLTGAFILGWLLRTLALSGPDQGWRRATRFALGTGVMGGYTTFSSFAVQSTTLIEHDHLVLALAYLVISLVGGFAVGMAGTLLATKLRRAA